MTQNVLFAHPRSSGKTMIYVLVLLPSMFTFMTCWMLLYLFLVQNTEKAGIQGVSYNEHRPLPTSLQVRYDPTSPSLTPRNGIPKVAAQVSNTDLEQ
jgi:hypothetical protein